MTSEKPPPRIAPEDCGTAFGTIGFSVPERATGCDGEAAPPSPSGASSSDVSRELLAALTFGSAASCARAPLARSEARYFFDVLWPMLGLTQLSNCLTLKGSFSSVSKPNFASKYAFESSRRDLHNALLCTALQSHFLSKFSILPNISLKNKSLKFCKFGRISRISENFCNFLTKF